MVELCGLKLDSKGAPTPITKATGKGRRDIDDDLEPHDAQTFRQAAGTGLYLSIDRPSLQFAMSAVMSGMSVPKVVHHLQAVRVAPYVLQHPGETWLCNCQANPVMIHVHTDTDWAADDLTMKSVSCSVERYGSHMLDCSVAKQSLVALSSGEPEFLRHCQDRGDLKANLTELGTDRNEGGGDSCLRQQCGKRDVRTGSGKVRHTPFNRRVVDKAYRKKEFQLVSVDTLLDWADIGTKAHDRAPDVVAEADAAAPDWGASFC